MYTKKLKKIMQAYKYINSKQANVQVYEYAIIQLWKCESMQICKNIGMQD